MQIKTTHEVVDGIKQGDTKEDLIAYDNKKWVSVNDLLEHFQKYRDKLSSSTHKADIKLRVYINSWMTELLERK